MLRLIVGSSLKFRYLVVALAAAMMFFGVQQLRHTAVDVFPEFAPPKVEVQTPSLGLSANQVEALVTIPLEQTLNGVPGLDEIRSKSVESLSSIEMIFKPGTDLLTARQNVAERIAQISPQLPTWASPPFMIQPLSATSRVMKIGLTTTDPDLDLIDLSMTTYWKIRTRLMRVPGVANIPIWGERIEMPTIQIDPERLRRHRRAFLLPERTEVLQDRGALRASLIDQPISHRPDGITVPEVNRGQGRRVHEHRRMALLPSRASRRCGKDEVAKRPRQARSDRRNECVPLRALARRLESLQISLIDAPDDVDAVVGIIVIVF